MTTIQHNTLTTTDLHENKGVSSASNNTVATASSGATVWKLLDNTNLGTLGNPFANFAQFREQQASGVSSSTVLGTSFANVTLNTTVVSQSWANLSGVQITLSAGTYIIMAGLPIGGGTAKLKLRNITGSADILIGQVTANGGFTLNGIFTLGGSTTVAIQGVGGTGGSGGGTVLPAAGRSVTEVYAEVFLWKVA